MKKFPFDYEQTKAIEFYPSKPPVISGDILEIGPGRGDWLMTEALLHPDKKFVSLEMSKKRFLNLSGKIKKNRVENILLIRGDARFTTSLFFSENTFEKISILFPDPWPKDRQKFRRLLSLEFLWVLAHELKKGGQLAIATDVPSYAKEIQDNLSLVTELFFVDPKGKNSPFAEYKPTFFEKKWRALEKEIYYLSYEKKTNS